MRGRCRDRDRNRDRDRDRGRDRNRERNRKRNRERDRDKDKAVFIIDRAAINDSNLCFEIQDHCQSLIYINFDKLIV